MKSTHYSFDHALSLRNINSVKPISTRFIFDTTQLQSLSVEDQKRFIQFGQGVSKRLPYHQLHSAFEQQAIQIPNVTAAQYGDQSISYQMLDQQANFLAMKLRSNGVRNGDNVGLFLSRSIEMLVGMIAILKVGAAYVPQDIRQSPKAKLTHIIEQANTQVILTTSTHADACPKPAGHVVLEIDQVMHEGETAWNDKITTLLPKPDIRPEQTCFILFTSGTTGKPNGVQVTHQNVCNILLTSPGNLGIKSGMKVGQILNIAFDMSAWEIWTCLSHGATLLIRGKSIAETVNQCDAVIATPSILSELDIDQCQNIKVAAVAGEPCPRPLADKWSAFCNFYNSCGPTETTIINTAVLHTSDKDKLTIGSPTPNNTVYVLDDNLQPCAIGETGEMWAGGDCVTAGYLNNPELNEDRYRNDPFLSNGRKMFRTRDLGRWTDDGELEHLGRTDDLVKIRGFRVELDAVSSALESVPECQQAVTLKQDNRNLVAFVTPATVNEMQAREAIRVDLPYYYEPANIIAVDRLPMTPRGKVDKKRLMEMAMRNNERKGEILDQVDQENQALSNDEVGAE
jgi:amino acid adenylation domain-containing protein